MGLWKILNTPLGELFRPPERPHARPASLSVARTVGGGAPRPTHLPPPDRPKTTADRLDAAVGAHGATWTRRRNLDGTVVMTAEFPDGERVVGRGATTAEAVDALIARLEAR